MPFAYVMKPDKHSFMDPRNIFMNESVAGTEALSPDCPDGESSSCEAWNPGKFMLVTRAQHTRSCGGT
jgi:hypothetical protein